LLSIPDSLPKTNVYQMSSTPQFTKSIASNVAYWRKRSQLLEFDAYRELNRDKQNIFNAVEFGLGLPETWLDTVELALALFDYFEKQGYWREWLPTLERILRECPQDNSALRGRILDQLGLFCRHNRQLEKALALHREEEEIGLQLHDIERIATARMQQSGDYWRMRQYGPAEQTAKAALVGFHDCGAGPVLLANAMMMIGLVNQSRGALDVAEEWLLQAINHFRDSGATVGLARALLNLGNILENDDKPEQALVCYNEGLSLLENTDNEVDKVRIGHSIGTLYFHQGDLAAAEAAFLRTNTPYMRRWGPIYEHALTIMNLANIYLAQGHLNTAEQHWHNCINLWQQADSKLMLANSLGGLAETLVAKGNIGQAIPKFDQALAIIDVFPDDVWGQRLKVMFLEERADALEKIKARPSTVPTDGRPKLSLEQNDETDQPQPADPAPHSAACKT
jgi:tetratricopeptide (TPR) repeat protein